MIRMLSIALAFAAGIGVMAASSCAPPASPAPEFKTAPAAAPFAAGTVVDLSHSYDAQTIVWPTSDKFRLDTVSDGVTEAGFYYAANNFFSAEHGGTHLDAPVHFAQGRQTVDRIPVDRLVGPAVIVDVAAAAERDASYQVSVADIQAAEQADGAIPAGSIVLFRTGYSRRWPDAARYLGTAERGASGVARLRFPGLHPDAARWLVANRSIKAVGIDTASIDYGQSSLYESHRALFEHDVPAFENLTSLESLPARGATIVALPMKIGGGSGAPLRAIALLP